MNGRPALGATGRAVMANVQRIRNLRGLTYKQLSDRLEDIGHPLAVLGLSRLERGERRVDVDDLTALAKALGIGVMDLLGEQDCAACGNQPPKGFTCNECGRSGS